jgi:hypothetical protein
MGEFPEASSVASTARSTKPAGRLKASFLYCPSDSSRPRTEGSAEAIGGCRRSDPRLSVASCDGGVGGGLQPKGILGGEAGSGVMTTQELDAFIRFALKTLPQCTASTEEARAVLIAEGIITADGELAAEFRQAASPAQLSGYDIVTNSVMPS